MVRNLDRLKEIGETSMVRGVPVRSAGIQPGVPGSCGRARAKGEAKANDLQKFVERRYRSGPSKVWPQSKNRLSEAERREREREED